MTVSKEWLKGIDRVIHEPSRLLIISILAAAEKVDFLFLLRETSLTKGNLSSHLSKLENAGYIEIEKTYKGKKPLTLIRLSQKGQTVFEQYTRSMADFMKSVNAKKVEG